MSDGSYESDPAAGAPRPRAERQLWVIAAVLAVIAVIAVALLVTTILDDDDDDSVATTDSSLVETTTSTSSSSTSTSTTTTSEPEATTTTSEPEQATTTSTSPPVTADPAECRDAGSDPDPDAAARAVSLSWTRGDSACARELMSGEAFDELFSRSGTGATDEFQGCSETDEVGPIFDCAFTYEGGSTHFVMQLSPAGGWQVTEVYQVAD